MEQIFSITHQSSPGGTESSIFLTNFTLSSVTESPFKVLLVITFSDRIYSVNLFASLFTLRKQDLSGTEGGGVSKVSECEEVQ